MKNPVFTIILTLLIITGYSQNNKLPDPKPNFVAIIVGNIDTSIKWYSGKLGFELLNRTEDEDRGFKQANIKRGSASIELIETSTSINSKEILDEKPRGSQIRGIFKFGFYIADFDHWINHLSELEVDFHGRVVQDQSTGRKMIIIKDPDGNRIQLFEE